MSSNINDNNPLVITLDNYEEYLLMYVDDELSAQERSLVEAFLKFHPELQGELDLLMSTKLEPELLSFEDKESLFAEKMGESAIDESLLLHVDDELSAAEKQKVEERLAQDEMYRKQHQLLLRTKSDPAEVVPYPNKEELYRHTVYRMRFGYALRIAAAVLLLASMGVVYWSQQQKQVIEPAVAVNTGSKKQSATQSGTSNPANTNQQQPGAVDANTEVQPADVPASDPANATQLAQATKPKAVERQTRNTSEIAGKTINNLPKEMAGQQLAYEPASVPNRIQDRSVTPTITADKNNFEPGVTSAELPTYTTTEPSAAEPSFASVNETEGQGKNRSFKVLLRKATRMVERRAHIDATNDDEELLIGAVAIKLK